MCDRDVDLATRALARSERRSERKAESRSASSPRMRRSRWRVVLCSAVMAAQCVAGDAWAQAAPAPQSFTSGIDRSTFDLRVRPQDDLYGHVNGRWLKSAVFPPDKAYIGIGEELSDKVRQRLRTLIEEADTPAARSADAEAVKLADLYASFMDEATLERLGLAPLTPELAAIDAVADVAQLAPAFARLDRIGVAVPFGLYVGQDDRDASRYVPMLAQSGLGLPDRDYYLQLNDAKFRAVRAKYVPYLARLLALAATVGGDARAGGSIDARAGASADARAVLALETALARAQWSEVENRDPIKGYNPVALADLPALLPVLDMARYAAAAGLEGRASTIIVRQPGYLRGLNTLLTSVPLATWKAYARTRLLDAYAPYLSAELVRTRFEFSGSVLYGATRQTPRWQRGVAAVELALGDALGKRFVARHFPPESQQRMTALVANLLAAYRDSIDSLDWMGPATKQEALAKLAAFNAKIGYPKHPVDTTALVVDRTDLFGNMRRAREFEADRGLAKLGQPVDRDEWGMTAQTINAYYDASLNEIVFPAGILQAPFFDARADDAANYGAIGSTIGHEISHGFDDEGSQYDGAGNLRNWWLPADRERLKARTRRLVAQYSAFEPVPGYRVNGALTLGENIADNAGLSIAYKAYRLSLGGLPAPVIDGMTGDERFFFGFAQAWRSKSRVPALLAQIKADRHTPDEFRVRGALRNLPAFYRSFGIKPGDRMYLPPSERVSTW